MTNGWQSGLLRFRHSSLAIRHSSSRRLPVLDAAARARSPRRYSRWRAATLIGVHVLIGVHIAHWKIAGATLAPLELNEVLYTLELGIITAGFLFMLTVMIGTIFFGRFFCSWACHILALEDLCAWLLARLRIRPRPIRSRILLLVPPAAAVYMFLWPQVQRLAAGQPLPQLRILSDADGWASFITQDFWRNLPGPWIAGLTFLICGFLIVYVLGSRSFCTYGCPYGALFRFADRFAPGRIRLVGDCDGCAICTAECQSHVRVHEEVLLHGRVVNPACLKDLDCVSVCPKGSLTYGFTRPAPLLSWRYIRRPFDFTLAEDALMVATFIATLLVFRGLYDAVPLLMTIGLAAIVAYLAVVCLRLLARPHVWLNHFTLRSAGRLTRSGTAFATLAAAFAVFFAHSAFIRYHEFRGQRTLDAIHAALDAGQPPPQSLVTDALAHLDLCERWGLVRSADLHRRLAALHEFGGRPETAERYYRLVLARQPQDLQSRLNYAGLLLSQQRFEPAAQQLQRAAASTIVGRGRQLGPLRATAHERLAWLALRRGDRTAAAQHCRAALAEHPDSFASHEFLADCHIEAGRYAQAVEHLRALVRLRPHPALRYNLAVLLTQLGRELEAIEQYRLALAAAPNDPDIHNNLGLLLAARGETQSASEHLQRAIDVNPDHANAHFNLGQLLMAEGQTARAHHYLRRAAQLDPIYAGE